MDSEKFKKFLKVLLILGTVQPQVPLGKLRTTIYKTLLNNGLTAGDIAEFLDVKLVDLLQLTIGQVVDFADQE